MQKCHKILSQDPKAGGFRELFLPENDFKNDFIACRSTNELKNCFRHLIGTSSKCNKFWGQNQNPTNQYS